MDEAKVGAFPARARAVNVSAKARKQLMEAAWRRTEAMCPVVSIFRGTIPPEVELETAIEQLTENPFE
jgi:hypothetical protein